MVQVRTEIPAGIASGWHTHPGEEVGYIIAGTVQMEIRDRPTLTLNAGDGFLIPPRVPHNALDLGPETGLMLSTYIVETGSLSQLSRTDHGTTADPPRDRADPAVRQTGRRCLHSSGTCARL